MLTAGQIAHFRTFGFLVLRQLFTAEEMSVVKRESDQIFDEETDRVRANYEGSRFCYRPAESYVNSDHPRLRRMVSRLVEWGFETSKV